LDSGSGLKKDHARPRGTSIFQKEVSESKGWHLAVGTKILQVFGDGTEGTYAKRMVTSSVNASGHPHAGANLRLFATPQVQ